MTFMERILISLSKQDKFWLHQQAKRKHLSTAEVVRRAIHCYQEEIPKKTPNTLEALLFQTKGIWNKGDGLAYQRKIRKEWNR